MATCVLSSLGAMSPSWLNLDFHLIFKKFEIWRLVSCFGFFGNFGIPFVIQMYLLVKYVGALETEVFDRSPRGTADLLFLMLFNGLVMLLATYLIGLPIPFLGSSLVFSCLYIFSRQDPTRSILLYGFDITAWKFPFVILALTLLMGGSIVGHVMGILTGHLFHFLWKIIPARYGRTMINTPEFIIRMCDAGTNARHFNWQRGAGGRLN
jgi:Derlin-2/3